MHILKTVLYTRFLHPTVPQLSQVSHCPCAMRETMGEDAYDSKKTLLFPPIFANPTWPGCGHGTSSLIDQVLSQAWMIAEATTSNTLRPPETQTQLFTVESGNLRLERECYCLRTYLRSFLLRTSLSRPQCLNIVSIALPVESILSCE